ncbi:hypothetical protein PTTG_08236 [Puccinia triticina 1-1 BBBD Race 1]|uniref:Phosphatidylserine decarboxylase n=1 Tax=Puccinia triticina (isolate 1-1 / race 1 (BBBD)) TaxID=630390 RepID=A0A180GEK3_PUCT1|nr:hypothetical protein PTTG_08236 [Puccinia triticina 1-1 BBBD Race 1]
MSSSTPAPARLISPLKGALSRVKNIPSALKPSSLSPARPRPKSKSPSRSPSASGELSNAVGMCSLEVNRAAGLPYWKAVTRLSFDMDPFVIISFGKKIFRTRVIRHSMDPVWDEKLFFHVQKSEMPFTILFSMYDWDKMSSNDYIGESQLLLEHLINDTQQNMLLDPETGLYQLDPSGKLIGDHMTSYELPVVHTPSPTTTTTTTTPSAEPAGEATYNGKLSIKAKFIPYSAMRQVFWRKYLDEFDTDDSATISTTELTSMLDSLGSTLTRETISGFFSRYGKSSTNDQHTLSFEQVIGCLESELVKPAHQRNQIDAEDEQIGVGLNAVRPPAERPPQPDGGPDQSQSPAAPDPSTPASPLVSISFIGHNPIDVTTSLDHQPDSLSNSPCSTNLDEISGDEPSSPTHTRARSHLRSEKVVNISCCPICHQEQPHSQAEIDMVTHMAVCASQDWTSLQNILSPGNFVTSSQANRKWFTKVIGKVQNGKYSLGANSANIIVQDRRTGKLIEEKMQAYVRLGIRLMYKSGGGGGGGGSGSAKENRMEHQKIKKLLKSLTIKQGIKFDSADSIKEIQPFINFHELDLNEVKLPLSQFKNFNEFFYRELKPNARPIESAEDGSVLTSVADCRLMVFKDLNQSKQIWIKGRRFSLQKLLGPLGLRNIVPGDTPPPPPPTTMGVDQPSMGDEKQGLGGPGAAAAAEEAEHDASNETSLASIASSAADDPAAADLALRWALAIFRLAPQDYHRFHSPIDGKIVDVEYIDGQYYTVNPMAIRSTIDVYGENVRVVVCIETEKFAKVYCVFVGAMMVGSINMSIKLGDRVRKGDDIGYFAFGGSTILVVVESDRIEWDADLQTNSSHSIETLVRVGTRVGARKPA